MKAVMLSIKPAWVELIAAGKKTLEIRKTRPKIEPPFKCFIYETKSPRDTLFEKSEIRTLHYGRGKVVGEFICDSVFPLSIEVNSPSVFNPPIEFPGAAMTDADIRAHLGNGKTGYAWCISELEIYSKPKRLDSFLKPCGYDGPCSTCKRFDGLALDCISGITRPPQSWFYVEALGGESHAATD